MWLVQRLSRRALHKHFLKAELLPQADTGQLNRDDTHDPPLV